MRLTESQKMRLTDAFEWNLAISSLKMTSYAWSIVDEFPRIDTFLKRNELLQWKNVRLWILDAVIAMSPLQLPPYVLLWIFDQLPHMERGVSHVKKIRLIESVRNSIWTIIEQRSMLKTSGAVSEDFFE